MLPPSNRLNRGSVLFFSPVIVLVSPWIRPLFSSSSYSLYLEPFFPFSFKDNMPSINATEILTNVNDEMMISPVNPSWAFNTQSSSFSTDARSEEEGRSSAMDPQEEFFYHYRRSFRDLSRVVRLRQAARQQQENEPRAITPFENPASSSHCLTNHENNMHTSPSIKYNHRLNLALSSYFLDFKVIYNDGGCFR